MYSQTEFDQFVEHIKVVYGSAAMRWDEVDWYDVINDYNEKSGARIEFTDCHHARRILAYHYEAPFNEKCEPEPPIILDLRHGHLPAADEHRVWCGVHQTLAEIKYEPGLVVRGVNYHTCSACGSIQDAYDSMVITVKYKDGTRRVAVR